jgi:hypothetical protein
MNMLFRVKSISDCALIIAKQSVLNWQYATGSCKYVCEQFLDVAFSIDENQNKITAGR